MGHGHGPDPSGVRATSPPPAVVIALDNITGLQTARLLARRGVRVTGIAADGRHPACRTNSCHALVIGPTSGSGLIQLLDQRARELEGSVLFPCDDASVRTLGRERDRLGGFRLVLPSPEVIDTLMGKDQWAAHAAAHGIPVPESTVVTCIEDTTAAADRLTFPCLVKPAFKSAAWEADGPKVRRIDSGEQLRREVPALLDLSPSLVLQEWVPGGDHDLYSCNAYVSPNGVPILTFIARKLRQWPPLTGTSSLGEAVRDERVRDLALRVLSTVPFAGLAYVEIKRDPTTNEDVVIEVNVGRPTGRSAIAEAGGVELVYTQYCDAVGSPLPADRVQRDRPVKWLYLLRDLQSALHYGRTGELSLASWVSSLRGDKVFADFDRDDPAPFVADALRRVGKLWRAVVTTGRRSAHRRRPVPLGPAA